MGPPSAELTPTERSKALSARHGGFDWIATFLGFTAAMFFLIVLSGIVATVVGLGWLPPAGAGAHDGRPGLRSDGPVGARCLAASLFALLIAYFIGGYAAGRLARYGDRAHAGL